MKWIILATLAVIGALTYAFHRSTHRKELIVFGGTSLGIAAGIIAAMTAALQLHDATEQNRLSLEHSKQEAAFAYLREWQALPLASVRQLMHDAHGKSPEEIQKLLVKNPKFHASAEQLINFFEVVGIAVRRGYADESVLCTLVRDASLGYHDVLTTWFRWYKDMRHMPDLFSEYDWLIKRWKNGCPSSNT